MHGSLLACVFLRPGWHVIPPSQKEDRKVRKRKEEKKSHQKRPDRARPSDRCAIRSPGVSCRSFCLQSSCRFFVLSHTLRFGFRQLDNPSWFRHRVPWPHLFTRGVVRFPPITTRLASFMCTRSSGSPGVSLDLAQLDVESSERSPVITWDSMKFLKTPWSSFMLHSIRHPIADVVRRSESVKTKQIERSRGD